MKRQVKIISIILILLFMLQIAFPVITNIEINTSYAAAIKYADGGVNYSYSNDANATLTINGTGTIKSNWRNSTELRNYVKNIKKISIGSSITAVESQAFYGCTSLDNVTIPNTVTSIGSSAFSGCTSLNTISIGTGVTSIGSNAFYHAPLTTKVTYNATNCTTYNNAFKDKQIATVAIGGGVTKIPEYFISGNKAVTSITIPVKCTSIGNYAFQNCSNITKITFTSTDTAKPTCAIIGSSAFANCTSLDNVTIPNSVTTIGSSAFSGCTSIKTLKVGTGVTSIGSSAFYHVPLNTKLTYNAINCTTYNNAFKDKQIVTVEIGANVTKLPDYFISGNRAITTIAIPAKCTTIGNYAFQNCSNITQLTFSGTPTCTNIGTYAIAGCTSLVEFKIPNSVTTLGNSAFYNTPLTKLTIEGDISNHNNNFKGNTSIQELTFGNKVTTIYPSMFENSTGIKKLTCGTGIRTVGERAFLGCLGLTDKGVNTSSLTGGTVTYPPKVTNVGRYAFRFYGINNVNEKPQATVSQTAEWVDEQNKIAKVELNVRATTPSVDTAKDYIIIADITGSMNENITLSDGTKSTLLDVERISLKNVINSLARENPRNRVCIVCMGGEHNVFLFWRELSSSNLTYIENLIDTEFKNTAWGESAAKIDGKENTNRIFYYNESDTGTNFTKAERIALRAIQSKGTKANTYAIFISDGEPTDGDSVQAYSNDLAGAVEDVWSIAIGASNANQEKYMKMVATKDSYYTNIPKQANIIQKMSELLESIREASLISAKNATLLEILNTEKWDFYRGSGYSWSSGLYQSGTNTAKIDGLSLDRNTRTYRYYIQLKEPYCRYSGNYLVSDDIKTNYTISGGLSAGQAGSARNTTPHRLAVTDGISILTVKPEGGIWENKSTNQDFEIVAQATKQIPLPIRNGFSFKGWTLEGTGSMMSSLTEDNATFTMGSEHAVLTASWERNNYELEVRPNGGIWKENAESEEKGENQTFTLAYEATKPIPVPRRNGYEFIGWTLEGQETESTMSSFTEDNATFRMGYSKATLTANWKLITHDMTGTITWNDEENGYKSRPSGVEVTLYSDEEVTEEGALKTPASKTVTSETYGFENLQTKKTKDNRNYEYRVTQNKVAGYETLINGYAITNNLILPSYQSRVITSPWNKLENEFVKNEPVEIVGMITVVNTNREKVGLGKEEVIFEIDKDIKMEEDSIQITYIDKDGNRREITEYTVENNQIKTTFETNRENDRTAGDSLKIEVKGTLQEMKEYTNTISYKGYLRDYETGEDTNINLGIVTRASDSIRPNKVSISIKEINEENEITNGSYFEIRKKETGEIIQSFMTKGKLEAIRKLEPMVEYVVIETKPIPGYTTAEEATFMVDKQGEIIIQEGAEKEESTVVIRDYKTRLQINIRDELTSEYVIGPTWQIIRKTEKNGQMVEEIITEWSSEGKPVLIEKLPIGEYTLREIGIGEETGYVTIGDGMFAIQDTKELQILDVEQKVSRVRVHLKDIETEEYVEGAVLQIIKRSEKDGKVEEKVIREWTTEEGGNLELKLPVGDYIIREIKLPEHSGYATIEDKAIKVVDTLEEQQVELKQGYTKIRIEIIDEETKEKIDNVEVEMLDKKTGEVIKLTETKEGYEAERVPIGEYIIREKTPEGYKEVEETEMKVEDTTELQIKQIENKRLIYDMQVEKELISITVDGEKKIIQRGEMQKVEIKESKIKTVDITLEYVIRVSNVGETKATVGTIIDNIPEGFKLVSTGWKQEGNQAIWNAEKEELEPGKSKEVRIALKWENKENNFGEKKNTAGLKGSTNPYGYEDKNKDNDLGEEITIFSIKTGTEQKTIIIRIATITLLAGIIISFMVAVEIVILKRRKQY